MPVEVRLSGPDQGTLDALAEKTRDILKSIPATGDVTDDWGAPSATLALEVDDARANRAGVTREDVAQVSSLALSGQLVVTDTRFGFMAFLGVASLVGVIVSHIIVLFDFIEESREHGVPLHRAVIVFVEELKWVPWGPTPKEDEGPGAGVPAAAKE